MEVSEVERRLVACIRANIEQSGGEAPTISRDTAIQDGIEGLDSLRAIEVLIELEDQLGCELPPEKVFSKMPEKNTIVIVSKKIADIVNQE
jgi:acyl carrier protein